MNSPIQYVEPLFRPPSEAYSLILQVTLGCSWNRCTFCEMYKSKRFKTRKLEDIFAEIDSVAKLQPNIRKVFLADGDALVLPLKKLLPILRVLTDKFPNLKRISSYALPNNILRKSDDELRQLKDSGLELIYLGIESGDDEVLKKIRKRETTATTIDALNRARQAGIQSSVMILSGLGGQRFSRQHAINSAKILNRIQPRYASTLVLSFPFGERHFKNQFGEDFISLNQVQLFQETRTFMEHTELKKTIFRSDHASNYLTLKGQLGRDKQQFLALLDQAITQPETLNLRPEWARGL